MAHRLDMVLFPKFFAKHVKRAVRGPESAKF